MAFNRSYVQSKPNTQVDTWVDPDLRCQFIVWGAPSLGPRSQVLARELGIRSLHFIRAGSGRGMLSAPFRYAIQAVKTIITLFREHPQVVFVQSPPSLAVLMVFIYSKLAGAHYVIDAHSAALLQRVWMWPHWLHRMLLKNAVTTLVTNDHFKEQIEAEGARAFVLPDVPSQFEPQSQALQGEFKIAVVNTFSEDEPLKEILAAAADLPEINFYITGNTKSAHPDVLALAPANAHFTGFLPDESYYGLLGAADGIMCLTTRQHTMQRGACEALSIGKPIITSDTALLKSYFSKGTVHVGNTRASIRDGVSKQRANLPQYQTEIVELLAERRREWQQKKQALAELIEQPGNAPR